MPFDVGNYYQIDVHYSLPRDDSKGGGGSDKNQASSD